VSVIAGIVGMSFLAAGWKFLWAPLGDYTLSRKRWYWLATGLASTGLIAMTVVPLSRRTVPIVSLLVLMTSVSSTFLAFATEGLMVHNTTPDTRGRAAGWFQSGNQFGQTAGGGIGLWLMNHTPAPWQAGAALAGILCLCATTLTLLEEPPRAMRGAGVGQRARDAWENLVAVMRSRAGRIGLLLAILPIGTGAAQFLFGSLAPEWSAPADTVSVVLGVGGGVAIVAGCFAGGRLADSLSKPVAYATCCALGLVAAVAIALSPRTPAGYTVSTLFYTFTLGMVAASFTALVLSIIGHSAAATTINLFFALSTLFSLGMLRLSGWAHDAWGTNGMLFTEAVVGVGALVLFFGVAARIRGIVVPAASARDGALR
jgi:predicted MFS family arabinose efflux permease